MPERAPKFDGQSVEDAKSAAEVRKAEVIPIREDMNNFALYSSARGRLTEEEYTRVTKADIEGLSKSEKARVGNELALQYAKRADVILSPESLDLYALLRNDPTISSDQLHGDQQRLIEVLRILGLNKDADTIASQYPG